MSQSETQRQDIKLEFSYDVVLLYVVFM